MKIKNPASRVFYFQSIRAVDIGTMDNAKMRSIDLLFYWSALEHWSSGEWSNRLKGEGKARMRSIVPLFFFFIAPVFPFP